MRGLFRIYQRILNTYPVTVQSVQTSILMATGDICAQTIVEKRNFDNYDPVRTVQFGSIGIILIGPALTLWYRILANRVGTKGSAVVLKKVALDQLIFAPCSLFLFMTILGKIQSKKFQEIKDEIKNKYFAILLANYKVWPAVQLFNFFVMPTNYQVLFVQSIAIFWNTYLSWKTQTSET